MTIPTLASKYEYKLSASTHIINSLKHLFFSKTTKVSLPLFVKGTDAISIAPQIFGYHEPHIKEVIEHFAANGFGNFLIDIGANIGLTSCQSGNKFKQVFMYEPNPDCFSILKVNAKISLHKCQVHLNPFGLGDNKSMTTLTIPKHNWGGAFIRDETNSYSDQILAEKDNFKEFKDGNYEKIQIQIESTTEVLTQVFKNLNSQSLCSGVIKIDVEGYELSILEALAKIVPKNFHLAVIFENFDKNFDVAQLENHFNGRANLFKLKQSPILTGSKIRKIFSLIFNGGFSTKIIHKSIGENDGDLILLIDNIK